MGQGWSSSAGRGYCLHITGADSEATAAAVGLKPLSWGGKTGDCGPGRRSFLWARPFCMRHITESCQTSRKVQIRMVKRKGGNKLFISKTLAFGDPRRSSIKW